MAKIKKAQMGKAVPKKKAVVDSVESEMYPGKKIARSASNYENGNYAKMLEGSKPAAKKAVAPKKKMKNGGKASFPDLNKDGKVTKADILKGRGVIKNGGKMAKKAMSGMKMMKGGGKCKNGC
jgi:hypothetical protein